MLNAQVLINKSINIHYLKEYIYDSNNNTGDVFIYKYSLYVINNNISVVTDFITP